MTCKNKEYKKKIVIKHHKFSWSIQSPLQYKKSEIFQFTSILWCLQGMILLLSTMTNSISVKSYLLFNFVSLMSYI